MDGVDPERCHGVAVSCADTHVTTLVPVPDDVHCPSFLAASSSTTVHPARVPSGLLSCSSAGSTDSGASWKVSGRRNRRMAVAPTEVWTEVVAGQGPPWCCDQVTATPVGQPPNSIRPTRPGEQLRPARGRPRRRRRGWCRSGCPRPRRARSSARRFRVAHQQRRPGRSTRRAAPRDRPPPRRPTWRARQRGRPPVLVERTGSRRSARRPRARPLVARSCREAVHDALVRAAAPRSRATHRLGDQVLEARARGHEHHARLGAELAGTSVKEPTSPWPVRRRSAAAASAVTTTGLMLPSSA